MTGSLQPVRPAVARALAGEPRAAPRRRTSDLVATHVFEQFPYGILVTSASGAAVTWNRAAHQLLGPLLDDPGGEHTCCELLGCRRAGTPLADACLTELALEAGGVLPELRVDLPHASPRSAAWVTVAPMGTNVIVHLRAGERGDRRRRSEPHWIVGPMLRVRTLGATHVESPEGAIDGKWLQQRSGQLFKLLLVERRRALHAEEVAQALWPGAGRAGLVNVRHFVHAARDQLEPGRARRRPSSFILARSGGYQLDASRIKVDADEFEESVRGGMQARADGNDARCVERLEHALDLYRGDFLADEPYAEWAMAERDRLRALAAEALRTLADIRLAEHDDEAGIAHLQRLVELDPFDVNVQRRVIALCLRSGRRSEAMRRYATLRQRLMATFGEVPDFDLAQLASEQGDRPSAPAA